MKPYPQPRTPVSLSDSVHHQLNMYALAASAAGVGVLVLAQPAEGKIVYTPANIPINVKEGIVYLDLNHDRINDFSFLNTTWGGGSQWAGALSVGPAQQSNGILQFKGGSCQHCASALPKGRKVGSKGPFAGSKLIMAYYQSGLYANTSYGPWRKAQQAYLGLKFMIKGKVHYGWARVKTLARSSGYKATITGYAYETIANKAIVTGRTKGVDVITVQSGSLGLLALGRK